MRRSAVVSKRGCVVCVVCIYPLSPILARAHTAGMRLCVHARARGHSTEGFSCAMGAGPCLALRAYEYEHTPKRKALGTRNARSFLLPAINQRSPRSIGLFQCLRRSIYEGVEHRRYGKDAT